jgi:hypothetical protein
MNLFLMITFYSSLSDFRLKLLQNDLKTFSYYCFLKLGHAIYVGRRLAEPVRRGHRFRQKAELLQSQVQTLPDLLAEAEEA